MFGFGKKMRLTVTGMSCGHCEQSVVKGLSDLEGIEKVKADHAKSQVEITYAQDPPDIEVISERIRTLGFEVTTC